MSSCPFCGTKLEAAAAKCGKCGANVGERFKTASRLCPKCGGTLKTESECPWCGAPIIHEKTKESEAYIVLKTFENRLRNFIQSELEKTDLDWWRTRVPGDIREVANSRRSRNECLYPWRDPKDTSPLCYVDFQDYAKIVTAERNWNEVFESFFKDKHEITTKLKELSLIRNTIAHCHDVNEKDLAKLKKCADGIASCFETEQITSADQSSFKQAESILLGEVVSKTCSPYGVLRLKCDNKDPEDINIEFSSGGAGDVVRPKPVLGKIKWPLGNRKLIEDEIRHLLQTVASQHFITGTSRETFPKFIQEVGENMYSVFPESIRREIQKLSERSMLALELDDSLVGLPWELAFDPIQKDYLCMRFGIGRVVYSENVAIRKRRPKRQTRMLLICNPAGNMASSINEVAVPITKRLESFGAEVACLSYDPNSSHHSSKENILRHLSSGSYDIVHFTGHGSYDSLFPQESGFAVADKKWLSAKDIADALDCSKNVGGEPPFIFYADSCESGAQEGWNRGATGTKPLGGLSEAIVRNNIAYIGASWAAAIKPTNWLALAFYDSLLLKNEPIGLALLDAKKSVKNEFRTEDVNCEWANFLLYGDPSLSIRI